MVKTETVYKAPYYRSEIEYNGNFSTPVGVWVTDNMECKNMGIKDALSHSKCLNGNIVDESIKNCLIFTFLDSINYGFEEDKFVEISYEELIAECEPIKIISYE